MTTPRGRGRGRGRAQWLPVRGDSPRAASPHSVPPHLPIYAYRQQILQHIQANTLTVIQGESGSGKSVGVPQIILDDAISHGKHACVMVAEPRSDQARSLATYVASLRGSNVGRDVCYVVNRFFQPSENLPCQLTYVTSSRLFEWFLDSKEAWQKMTHLILDDVDSRTADQDLLFLLVRLILLNDHASPSNKNKKIVIISGRLSHCSLEDYFSFLINRKGAFRSIIMKETKKTPKVIYLEELKKELPTLPATALDIVNTLETFPATGKNIPRVMFDLIGEIVVSQARPGDIFLIFLPGLQEMHQLKDTVAAKISSYTNHMTFKVGLLHGQLALWEQEKVLSCTPTQANIIISTNFAEKSIMVPRVKYVIDLGLEKNCYFNKRRGIDVLAMGWTSRTSLQQRAMQASCDTVFRLFTRQTYEHLEEDAITEMGRSCLSYTLLRMKAKMHTFGPVDVLFEQLLEPPAFDNLNQTVKILIGLGAIHGQYPSDFSLTQLGKLAVALELDVQSSQLIILGLLLCCSVECVIIAAGLMLPADLFKRPYLQSGCKDEFLLVEHKLHYLEGKNFYGNDRYNDMIIFCNVYRHWLNKGYSEKRWISETCINRSSLQFLIEKVQLLASGLAAFLEAERLVKAMESEHQKIVELKKGHSNQSCRKSWMFCDDVTPILLSITGAFNTNIFLGNVSNIVRAQEEFKEISVAGLDPENTFKLLNVPTESLNNFDDFYEALQVLGPVSKVLLLEGSNDALVECSRSSTEKLLQHIPRNLPMAAQKAYFLASHKSGGGLSLSYKRDNKIQRVSIGGISRARQFFWSTYLKGRKYGVNFEGHCSLPQCAFELRTQEQFLVAVAAKFIGAENTKVSVSVSTLLPTANYFAITALLLFRSFQAYLIRTDAAQKCVYSLQYGPLIFDFRPQYIIVDQLHLVEKIRKKLNGRVVESQLCEGYIVEEVLHLMHWVASQKHCEPHHDPAIGSWQEYPSLKPTDKEHSSLAWKLNMIPIYSLNDGISSIDKNSKIYNLQETEESCLLQAFRTVEPDLTMHNVEEWLGGTKEFNQVFYSLLEKMMADPEHKEKAHIVLKTMHKRCDELVPKKKMIQLESWYHLLCNPMLSDGVGIRNPQAQKLLLQKQNFSEGLDRIPHYMHNSYAPFSSKTVSLTAAQINSLRGKIGNNTNQARILLPKSQSLTDSVVIFGHPTEVEATMKWIELVATRSDTRRYASKGVNQTHFVPETLTYQIRCVQLGKSENLYGEASFKGYIQFFVEGCIDNLTRSSEEMGLDLGAISRAIKSCISCIARADNLCEIEVQARLGRVVFACSQGKKKEIPFESDQLLGVVLDALKRKACFKQYFSDTITKADYFHTKACLKLFKSSSVTHEKKITIFLVDPAELESCPHATKITIKENIDEPGHFELMKVQQKERLAVVDLVHLRTGHVKSDIRLSVQGLRDGHIEDRFKDFVSKIRLDGVNLKFPKGPFEIQQLRIKDTEVYLYDDFSVSMNEISQMKGQVCLQKYEVEISPFYLGKSLFSAEEVIENLDSFLSKIVTHAQTIISQLYLNQASSSSSVLAHAILCLWKTRITDPSYLKCLLHQHMKKDYQLADIIVTNKKLEGNAPLQIDIATLVDIIWEIDGLDFDSINLSESVLSFFLGSLQLMKFATCQSTVMKAQEIISRQGFPPRIALGYASLFSCHCFRYHTWTRAIAPHLSMLMVEEPNHIKKNFHKSIDSLCMNNHDQSHSLNITLESILLALGRHWANRSPTCFLRIYGLALRKEQNCPSMSNLLDNFGRKLFSRYPSEAARFVLGLASSYMIGMGGKDTENHEYYSSLMRLLNLIKNLKVFVTEDCRILALNMLLSLEDMDKQMQDIEKMVYEIFEIDVTTFRHCHYQKILSKILPLRASHLKELERRGLMEEFCQKMELKSWIPGRQVASSWLIPGLDKRGKRLIGSPGIFIPARDPLGQIIGAQIKVDQPTTGKYKWLSSNKVFEGGKGPNIDDEWPLFCCTSLFGNFSTLGMCEGGLKAHALSFLGALPVIGASGAAFSKSKRLLERYLALINPDRIIFFPDAGSQCNDQVTRCYFQTFRLLREFGYFLLIAWWGQVNKTEHEDIDDLLCSEVEKHNIPLLSPLKFWHILHPAVKNKLADEFPEYSGSSGASGLERHENFTDVDDIAISRTPTVLLGNKGPCNAEYLISIPKKMIKSMPSPPNDLVTPSSVPEFTLEVRMVKLSEEDVVDTCMDWLLQDTLLSTACLGLVCQYDSQGNPSLLELSLHQRCLLIQIPNSMDPHFTSRKLQGLLSDADVVKVGVNIDKDALYLYHSLHLRTNNCIKLSLPSADRRQKVQVLEMFRTIFKWEWSEKAEVKYSNWRLDVMTLEQIKLGALSAWACHLIWAQMKESLSGPAQIFSIDGVHHQLLDYFQRSMRNIDASSYQSQTSFELAGATVEIQQGFLILNPGNARRFKVLNSKSVVKLGFNDGRDPEEYTTKRVCERNVLLKKGVEKFGEPEVDASAISKLVVDNSNSIDIQRQKLGEAIHSLLCNPEACPPHILMALGCIDIGNPAVNNRVPLPQGIMLNKTQIDALRMMLYNPLCAIIGPPGTGKTRLISGAAKVWEQNTAQGEMLLCAAQQNVAVRHMAEMMVKSDVQGVMLLISHDYYTGCREEEYKHIDYHMVVSGPALARRMKAWTARNKRSAPRILLCTLALVGSSSFYTCVKHCNITYMIIDESSQAAEETLISSLICLPYLERLSVLGDPCQLPPFGKSVQSVFDLVARNCEVLTLQLQYRTTQDIANFVSREFYGGVLTTARKDFAGDHGTSLLWVDVDGSPKVAVGSTSLCNEREAEAIVQLCKKYRVQEAAGEVLSPSMWASSSSPSLVESTSTSLSSSTTSSSTKLSSPAISSLSSSSSLRASLPACSSTSSSSSSGRSNARLVVLTLYEAQRLLISRLLTDNEVQGVSVHNVDSFQGQEAEIIVVSLVVGSRMSPFASDRRRACVLLSRAKSMLYIFGSFKALSKCNDNNRGSEEPIIWKSLALECAKNNWVAKAASFLGDDKEKVT